MLQPTYRIEARAPVILLYGVLDGGGSFLIRETRQTPHFWIRASQAGRARSLGATIREEEPARHTMDGQPVTRVEIATPPEVPALRDRLTAEGIACFEADVRFAYRFLIDHGIQGGIEIHGAARPGKGVTWVFDDPEIRPADFGPDLKVLSFDIETDPTARTLLSISLAGCGASEVLLVTPPGASCPAPGVRCDTESDVLARFVQRVRDLDPDVLTGWNCIDFDLTVLLRMSGRLGVPLALGRGWETLRLRSAGPAPRATTQALIPGRLVLDGMHLVRGAFLRFDSYSLDAVAHDVLGEGKIIHGTDRGAAILEAFRHDRQKFVDYNLKDARLVLDILDRLHLIELSVQRSRLTGMPPDRVTASIASFDFLYLSELTRRGIVAPTVDAGRPLGEETGGGQVLDPAPGLYRNVLVLDFASLYPSLIRTFNIDPLGHVVRPGPEDDCIRAPNGASFRRPPGILPSILDDLFPRRAAAKAAGDRAASSAIKILMNSFYGVLGTPACRFASPALANAITSFGREILLWSRDWLESRGLRVLYGDTDSLFVESTCDDAAAARTLGEQLVGDLNRALTEHVAARWRVTSRLDLEFERLYLRLLLPASRHGAAGARKRYAGLVEEGGVSSVLFTGMEAVRSDWTDLAREVQRTLFERLFTDRPVDEFLRDVVSRLRAGRLDSQLVYRKALRKPLDAYTTTTPPHVAAARKMSVPPQRRISYVMTHDGPEPAHERHSPVDHEHYVQKQIRAVAGPVLEVLGLDFDRVVGDDSQMKLF
ncbi:MAG: DNA polymerase II [Acidobacteriota bacterium]